MDNAHLDELMGELASASDSRLAEFAKRDSRRFALLLAKVIDAAVERGVPEGSLHLMVSNAVESVPQSETARLQRSYAPLALAVVQKLRGKSFDITWGPDHGRPAGYYVSIPSYGGGRVVPLAEVEALLNEG